MTGSYSAGTISKTEQNVYDTTGLGRLVSTTDEKNIITAYGYDEFGRVVSTSTTIPNEDAEITTTTYDSNGKISEEIDMNGFEFSQFSNCGDDLLVDFLSCIRDLNYIAEIKLVNSDCIDVRGNIVDISNGYVEIDVVDDYNEKDGKAFCKLDSISVVWISLE